MESTLDSIAHSSLTYISEDTGLRFVHDTLRDFFAAKYEFNLIQNAQDQVAAVAQTYSRILNQSQSLSGTNNSLWIYGDNLKQQIRALANFLGEMSEEKLNHSFFEKLKNDTFLNEHVVMKEFYSAGEKSKVIVHFNPMIEGYGYMTFGKKQITIFSHFTNQYDINLFLVAGASGELICNYFNYFPNDPDLTQSVLDEKLKRSILTPLEAFLVEQVGRCTGVGIEDMKNYEELLAIELKKLRKEKLDSSKTVELYLQRSSIVVKNSIKKLDDYKQNIAFLDYFHNGTLGKLNPYHFLSQGVSYVLLELKKSEEFDFQKYSKYMLDRYFKK